mmetsp:Transcript_5453/g.12192  ORF Transcript_5453/g.12192 Transcript_5453/m.12192 type:complete len:215 (-) Transcript_5453:100-744(-)
MYLIIGTKPELSFAIHYLSRFNKGNSTEHMKVMKGVAQYVKGVAQEGITFQANTKYQIRAYCDASFAMDEKAKSTSGRLIYLDNNLIHYATKVQSIVSMSSCEAELNSIVAAAMDLMELRHTLNELGIQHQPKSIIFTDSQAAVALIMSEKKTERSKHIDVRRYKLKEFMKGGNIEIKYIPGIINLSDITTKNCGVNVFTRLKDNRYIPRNHTS